MPPFHKHLPKQRLAYAGMAVIIALLIVSGLVKTYKNVYAPEMSYAVVLWATWAHNIGFVFFAPAFVAYIGAIVHKPNRPMLRGILTGSVRLDYAEHRHPLWIAEIEGAAPPAIQEPPADRLDTAAAPGEVPAPAESVTEAPHAETAKDRETGAGETGDPPEKKG